ncbi:hypothetical protein NQ318_012125 [Aromia moschata]|uniref:Signal peptidase complex subunit 3 n=1 Tax=Aromia moschata TaxID=1265417 RepID=A0AAV8YRN2_9CUCU|nr:hypothetical protein NQ318_012125 [Aromia moschata]
MHSVLQRANSILAYALSVLACLTFACFVSTVFLDYVTDANINTVKVVVKNVPDYSASREKNDLGFLTFDLQTDLTHLFNWNVKQLFLYLTAEYETSNNELNQVSKGNGCALGQDHIESANKNITLTLSWNIIPNAGLLPNIFASGSHSFQFPVEYTTSRM